jgi:hypothetical protein
MVMESICRRYSRAWSSISAPLIVDFIGIEVSIGAGAGAGAGGWSGAGMGASTPAGWASAAGENSRNNHMTLNALDIFDLAINQNACDR